jgi:hypothetical protein
MKHIFISIFTTCLLISSCTSVSTLYSWEKYNIASYNYLKVPDEKTEIALIANYEKIINKQRGTRRAIPPGVYADYAFILLQKGEYEKGNSMLEKEIELYPESKIFIDRIINMMKK